jgi:hypothetical protein
MLLRVQCTLLAPPKEELQTKLVLAQVFSTHYAYQIDSINFFLPILFVMQVAFGEQKSSSKILEMPTSKRWFLLERLGSWAPLQQNQIRVTTK